jgi:hypothetical protein
MKNYLLLFFLLTGFGFVCNSTATKNCLKGKVIRISCASYVVQVLNKQHVGDYGWKDEQSGKTYDNVINFSNPCHVGEWKQGDEIFFSIKDSSSTNDCVTCMMYDAPPKTAMQVENVSKNPCR